MIELKELTIGYRSRKRVVTVAEGLDAMSEDGTLTCLVGVNGIGKSTLLRTVAGFQAPLGGTVIIGDGTDSVSVNQMTDLHLSRTLSVVLTEKLSETNLKVYDVVGLGRSPYTGLMGGLTDADRSIVEKSLELAGISALADRCMDEMSDGERQKVMIAKALAQQTPVIVLDEPSAFLDYPSKEELMKLLMRLAHDEGKTILISSHDLDIVRRTSDCFWIMERIDGKTVIHTEKSLDSI